MSDLPNDIAQVLVGGNPFDKAHERLCQIERHGTSDEKEGALIMLLALECAVSLRRTKEARASAARHMDEAVAFWKERALSVQESE